MCVMCVYLSSELWALGATRGEGTPHLLMLELTPTSCLSALIASEAKRNYPSLLSVSAI